MEVIPHAVNPEPLAGNHDTVCGEVVPLLAGPTVYVLEACHNFVPGIEAPVVTVLYPAGFQYTIGFKVILYAVNGLPAVESLAVLIV